MLLQECGSRSPVTGRLNMKEIKPEGIAQKSFQPTANASQSDLQQPPIHIVIEGSLFKNLEKNGQWEEILFILLVDLQK